MGSKNKNDSLWLNDLHHKLRLFLPLLIILACSARGGDKLPDKKQISEDMLSSGRSYVFYITVTPIIRAGATFYRLLGRLSFNFYPVITGQTTAPLTGDAHLETVTIPEPAVIIPHQASPNWPAVTMNLFEPDSHELATAGNGASLPAVLPPPQPSHASFSGTSIVPYRKNHGFQWFPGLSTTWNLPALLAHPGTIEQMDEEDTHSVLQGMEYMGALQNQDSQEILPVVHVFSNLPVTPDYHLLKVPDGAVSPSNVWPLARNNPGLVLLLICTTRSGEYGAFVLIINNLMIKGLRRELFQKIHSRDRKPDDGSPPAPGSGGSLLQTITFLTRDSATGAAIQRFYDFI